MPKVSRHELGDIIANGDHATRSPISGKKSKQKLTIAGDVARKVREGKPGTTKQKAIKRREEQELHEGRLKEIEDLIGKGKTPKEALAIVNQEASKIARDRKLANDPRKRMSAIDRVPVKNDDDSRQAQPTV